MLATPCCQEASRQTHQHHSATVYLLRETSWLWSTFNKKCTLRSLRYVRSYFKLSFDAPTPTFWHFTAGILWSVSGRLPLVSSLYSSQMSSVSTFASNVGPDVHFSSTFGQANRLTELGLFENRFPSPLSARHCAKILPTLLFNTAIEEGGCIGVGI